jgi:MprA protease rhombosortase-interaction domain-containing protein
VFYLDGAAVETISEMGVSQSFVHIGPQSWTLPVGLVFDTATVNYSLLTSTTALTTIQSVPDIFDTFGSTERPFFRHSSFEYIEGAVPVPGTLTLVAIGLAGFGLRRSSRRKRHL